MVTMKEDTLKEKKKKKNLLPHLPTHTEKVRVGKHNYPVPAGQEKKRAPVLEWSECLVSQSGNSWLTLLRGSPWFTVICGLWLSPLSGYLEHSLSVATQL